MALKDYKKLRVDAKDPKLEFKAWPEYYEYDGEPFNGYETYGFEPNENPAQGITISAECEYRDGFRMGWYRKYYPNGNVKYERLDLFETPLLNIFYNEQGIEVDRFKSVSQAFYNEVIAEYNILDK